MDTADLTRGTAVDRICRALLAALSSLVPGLAGYQAVDRWGDDAVDGPTVRVLADPAEAICLEDGAAYAGAVELTVVLRAPAGSAAAESWDLERPAIEAALHAAPRLVAAMREADPGLPPSSRWVAATESVASVDGDVVSCAWSGRLVVPAPLTTPVQE